MPHGEMEHLEIPADDPERAQRFYAGVLDWQFSSMTAFPAYYLFRTAPERGGAIGRLGQSAGETVRPYITVDSIDEAVAKAEQLGGKVLTTKQEIPGQGWFAILRDTEGNELPLFENLRR